MKREYSDSSFISRDEYDPFDVEEADEDCPKGQKKYTFYDYPSESSDMEANYDDILEEEFISG